jgi:lipopolysaccharide/colanic/teichoic acid biosynthesis glycosyltransferase
VHHETYQRISRLLDILLGSALLLLLVLAVPIVLIGNVLGNRGPLFYRQERIGRNNEAFAILKFRTMKPDNSRSVWTSDGDPRITQFGSILRRLHIDELPQAINILRGELAFVGPRPEQVHYVEMLSNAIPLYPFRHSIRPGLTGWAQVNYRYGSTIEDARVKLEYDLYYLRHQGLAIDLIIVAKTLRNVLGMRGK